MKLKQFFTALLLLTATMGFTQTLTHEPKVRLQNTPASTLKDTLIGINDSNIVVKSDKTIGDVTTQQDVFGANAVMEGGVVHLGNYDYFVWASRYIINGVYYEDAIEGNVTLSAADPAEDRIDVFYVQNDGLGGVSVGVAEGVPAANPLKPTLDFTLQSEISFDLVQAATSGPGDTSTVLVYDENLGQPLEWNNTTVPLSGYDPAYTLDQYNGSLSYQLSTVNTIGFTGISNIVAGVDVTINMAIKLSGWSGNSQLVILLQESNNDTNKLIINRRNASRYNLDIASTTWQFISIPLSEFLEGLTDFDEIEISHTNFTAPVLYDYIFIQTGTPGTPGGDPIPVSFLDLVDTPDSYSGQGDNLIAVRNDESGLEFVTVPNPSSPSGLEAIDEGNGIGWRLIGRDPANYGNIGVNDIDFSNSTAPSTTMGAFGGFGLVGGQDVMGSNAGVSWGDDIISEAANGFRSAHYNFGVQLTSRGFAAFTFGLQNSNRGHSGGTNYNTVLGRAITSTAVMGIQAGRRLSADGIAMAVFGAGNATTGNNNNSSTAVLKANNQPIFVVGNGGWEDGGSNSDLIVGTWRGDVSFPTLTNTLIDNGTDDYAVTKGWVTANTLSGTLGEDQIAFGAAGGGIEGTANLTYDGTDLLMLDASGGAGLNGSGGIYSYLDAGGFTSMSPTSFDVYDSTNTLASYLRETELFIDQGTPADQTSFTGLSNDGLFLYNNNTAGGVRLTTTGRNTADAVMHTINLPEANGTVALTSDLSGLSVFPTPSQYQMTFWNSANELRGTGSLTYNPTNDIMSLEEIGGALFQVADNGGGYFIQLNAKAGLGEIAITDINANVGKLLEDSVVFGINGGNSTTLTRTTPTSTNTATLPDATGTVVLHETFTTPIQWTIPFYHTTDDYTIGVSDGLTYDATNDILQLTELTGAILRVTTDGAGTTTELNSKSGQEKIRIINGSNSYDMKATSFEITTAGGNITVTNNALTGSRTQNFQDADGDIALVEKDGVYRTKVTLSAAQILSLNSTPITAVAAPGVGKIIRVISAFGRINYGTTTFDHTTGDVRLTTNGINAQATRTFLKSTATNIGSFTLPATGADTSNLAENTALTITSSDNGTTGDSTVDIYITYEIITL